MRRTAGVGAVLIVALAAGTALGLLDGGRATVGANTPRATAAAMLAPTASPIVPLGVGGSGVGGSSVGGSTPSTAPSLPPGDTPVSAPTPSPVPTPYHGPMTRLVPVLMYHLVGDPPPGEPYPGLFVSVADFTAQMQALKDGGWRTITAAELGADMAANRPVPARTIVLTFDDGNVDGYTTVFPILQAFGFRATFYMIAAGGGGRMTVPELASMARAGMEIANHTLDHRNVSRLSPAKLYLQIAVAELRIESELAAQGIVTTVRTFAYPAGHTSAPAVAYLAGRGYTAAFTERPGVVSIGLTDPLLAPRLRVSRFTTMPDFLAMLPVEPRP
jgi:peptidoglycan/xylan/chitin deacetylase (PgdA/CDA1 family)